MIEFVVVAAVVELPSHVRFSATSWIVPCQACVSMGFPRQAWWSGLPFPAPGDLPKPGIKPVSCIGRWTLYCCATRETPQKLWKWPQIFEKSVFKDTIKLRISRSWFKAGSKSKDGCPFKRRGEDNGEKIMWRPIWKSRLRLRLFCPMPRNTRSHWNLGEARKCSPQELSEKSSPCCHLDSRLQAYIIHNNLFLLFWATSL